MIFFFFGGGGGGGGGGMEGFGHLFNIKKIGYMYKKPFSVIAIFLKLEVMYIKTFIQEFVKNEESIHSIEVFMKLILT